MNNEDATSSKDTSVGYKRPPVEHQFKRGQKPPPRKRSSVKAQSTTELLIKILNEEQRVEIGRRVRWCTNAELLAIRAFQLAERGNATLTRALLDHLLVEQDSPTEDEWRLSIERDGEAPFLWRMSGGSGD
jgi:hypothetical protein